MGLRMEANKKCTKCGETKPLLEFYRARGGVGGRAARCRVCTLEYMHEYQKKPKAKACQREYKMRVKSAAFNRIGGMRCALCGCDEMIFLTVDHADGNGVAHRKQLQGRGRGGGPVYSWIVKASDEELAKWNLRILCYNCNCALNYYTEATVKAAVKRNIHSRLTAVSTSS